MLNSDKVQDEDVSPQHRQRWQVRRLFRAHEESVCCGMEYLDNTVPRSICMGMLKPEEWKPSTKMHMGESHYLDF
jgi:hypothetical protein